MKQRFIIEIDDEDNSFDISTPDGPIPLDDLLFVLDSTIHTLVEANNDDLDEHFDHGELDDVEETTPLEKFVSDDKPKNKKDLN